MSLALHLLRPLEIHSQAHRQARRFCLMSRGQAGRESTHLGTAPPREAAVARCPESLGQCGCGSCSKGPFSETDLCPGAGALVPHTHPSLPFFTSHLCFWPFDRCLQLSCIRHVAIPRLSLLVYRMGGIYSCLKFRSRGLGQPSHSDSPILPQCSLPPNC